MHAAHGHCGNKGSKILPSKLFLRQEHIEEARARRAEAQAEMEAQHQAAVDSANAWKAAAEEVNPTHGWMFVLECIWFGTPVTF